MRLASVNLNKRLGNPAARARLTAWLEQQRVDVLVAQEPWKPAHRGSVSLERFQTIGGDGRLCAWIAEPWMLPQVSRPANAVQRIELSWLVVFNVYLDAYARATRATELVRLRGLLEAEAGRPALVVGDFNLAPRPEDGRYDGLPSFFNSNVDRMPFVELLATAGLTDCTAGLAPAQYSLTRVVRGKIAEFRCDLALLSDYLCPSVRVAYDHSVRAGDGGFTDHSALLIDLPVTLEAQAPQDSLFDISAHAETGCQPHKTAMSRSRPSPFARAIAEMLASKPGSASILDHGCGRGADVRFYRDCGLDADGWDPHPGFGWSQAPKRQFDLVTSVFVLNVLPNPWERIRALQHAAGFMRPGGRLLTVTRSPHDIDRRAEAANWTPHHDGYWSCEGKRTFQRGICGEEIIALGRRAGLAPAPGRLLGSVPSTCQALLAKMI